MEQWDVLEFLAYCYARGIKIRRNPDDRTRLQRSFAGSQAFRFGGFALCAGFRISRRVAMIARVHGDG